MSARVDHVTDWSAVGEPITASLSLEAFAAESKRCEVALGIGDDGGLRLLTPTEYYAAYLRLLEGFRAHTATIRAYAEAYFDVTPRTEMPQGFTALEKIASEIARRGVVLRLAYPANHEAQFLIGFGKHDHAEIETLGRWIRQHQEAIENLLFAFELYESLTPSERIGAP